MAQVPEFLKKKNFEPLVEVNPDLDFIGTETAFSFGAKVIAVESSGKFDQVYKFHVGDTGPRTPQPIIDTAIQALKDKQTKYGHFQGYPQVRENIANYISETRGVKVGAENIILQPGGKPVIEMSIQALVGPDSYLVGPNPGYPIYESLGKFYTEGKRYIPWTARYNEQLEKLVFEIEDLKEILEQGKKVSLLILNTPQNPTGLMLPQEQLEAVAELAIKYNFMVLFDDIYDQITFGGRKHVSLLSIPGMQERTINLNGYSKDYAMTGWRLGFIVAPKWVIEIFGRLAINKWSCVNRMHQIIAGCIFGDVDLDGHHYPSIRKEVQKIVDADVLEYEKKGNFLVEALQLVKPYVIPNPVEGAFYDYPYVAKLLDLDYVKNDLNIKDDKDLSKWLLYEKGFAALAGSDFGNGGKGFIRFSYAEDRDLHIIPGMKYFIKVVIEIVEKSGKTDLIKAEEVDALVDEIARKHF